MQSGSKPYVLLLHLNVSGAWQGASPEKRASVQSLASPPDDDLHITRHLLRDHIFILFSGDLGLIFETMDEVEKNSDGLSKDSQLFKKRNRFTTPFYELDQAGPSNSYHHEKKAKIDPTSGRVSEDLQVKMDFIRKVFPFQYFSEYPKDSPKQSQPLRAFSFFPQVPEQLGVRTTHSPALESSNPLFLSNELLEKKLIDLTKPTVFELSQNNELFSVSPSEQDVAWISSIPRKFKLGQNGRLWAEKLEFCATKLKIWDKVNPWHKGFVIALEKNLLKSLMRKVWNMNARIHEYFFILRLDRNILKESQIDLFHWIYEEMKLLASKDKQGTRKLNWALAREIFAKASAHETPKTAWKVNMIKMDKGPDSQMKIFSQQTLLETQAVIGIIGSYYKARNGDKWKRLFPQDKNFVDNLLKEIRRKLYSGLAIGPITKSYRASISRSIFPWSHEVQPHLKPLRAAPNLANNMDDFVYQIVVNPIHAQIS
ncbi:hypothetical protein O181_004191 [Austropuccinia psidii MF-1]|uniref:Uncharacterized protein n=1 Tax=Austropuccinia psidii MF-1 TaxID=1389203 RepID=A0A9Q3BF35_9BASI|nr:hypothetical protein [Austropuccinia psidii MF-1]